MQQPAIRSLLILFLSLSAGCGASQQSAQGATEQHLLQRVSFDHECPEEQIEVESRKEVEGKQQFVLRACGNLVKYEQDGDSYKQLAAEYSPGGGPLEGGADPEGSPFQQED